MVTFLIWPFSHSYRKSFLQEVTIWEGGGGVSWYWLKRVMEKIQVNRLVRQKEETKNTKRQGSKGGNGLERRTKS